MLKQALDTLKKAELDAEQVVVSARRRAQEIRKSAEDSRKSHEEEKVFSSRCEAKAMLHRYEDEAKVVFEGSRKESDSATAEIDRLAGVNMSKAMNKAVERIVRRNGHR